LRAGNMFDYARNPKISTPDTSFIALDVENLSVIR
jgi:hypothetical protein